MPATSVYTIRRTETRPPCDGDPTRAAWRYAEQVRIKHFRPESAPHHTPTTTVRLLHDASTLYALFEVNERYVRCVNRGWMTPTYQDACVELFVRPAPGRGYFNFEVNCGGALWCSYIEDWTRTDTGFKAFTPFSVERCQECRIYHSMPEIVDPELPEPVEWRVELHVPFTVLEHFTGTLGARSGTTWSGNMYKCAEKNSHPHWAAWAPVSTLNFHVPDEFGSLRFE